MTEPCHNRVEEISRLLTNDLDPETERDILQHLKGCSACHDYYRDLLNDHHLLVRFADHLAPVIQNIEGRIMDERTTILPSLKNRWFPSWNTPFSRRAVTAVSALTTVILVLFFFCTTSDLTLAQVQEALANQDWLHLQYNNGREIWASLKDGKVFRKNEDGCVIFVDHNRNRRQVFQPEFGECIHEDQPVINVDGSSSEWESQSPWEYSVGYLEQVSGENVNGVEVERHNDIINATAITRFDTYFIDALNRRLLVEQVWANPKTRLPVRIRERLTLAERKKQSTDFIEGIYDFPITGPASIHDLGVPRGLPIIPDGRKVENLTVAQILESAMEVRDRFPHSFRLIQWEDPLSETDVIYWNGVPVRKEGYEDWSGVKLRQERYFYPGYDGPDSQSKLPLTAEHILDWTQNQIPVQIDVSDGVKQYSKTGPFPERFVEQEEPCVRVLDVNGRLGFNSSNFPREYLWPFIGQNLALVEESSQKSDGKLLLRSDAGDTRRDFHVDLGRDFICETWIWWKKKGNEWVKEREYKLSDFIQFPDGQWYAAKRFLTTFAEPDKGLSKGGANWNVDIKVLAEGEFPPDIFNGKVLLESVKKIETY